MIKAIKFTHSIFMTFMHFKIRRVVQYDNIDENNYNLEESQVLNKITNTHDKR